MKIRSIDENNDWNFGKGIESYKKDSEALKQNIKTKILEWKGDCFFANNNGIDWINRLEKNQQNNLIFELKSLILKIEGVVELVEINSNFKNRVLTISYKIRTIYSSIIQEQLEVA